MRHAMINTISEVCCKLSLPKLLSDEIPQEVDVTGKVKFLPLSNINIWADILSEIKKRASNNR